MNRNNLLSEEEYLIAVDPDDTILGYKSKEDCHKGGGLLHRAFSIFIFNDQKELLIQKRSAEKNLWPFYWSNSVCSHPRKGEEYEEGARRRLDEELGIRTSLHYLFKFQYQARYDESGSENEICCVFIGKGDGEIRPNKKEIEDWKYINMDSLNQEIMAFPEYFTPWFKIEWDQIQKNYENDISRLLK